MNPLTLKSRYGLLCVSPRRWQVVEYVGCAAPTSAEYPASLLAPIGGPVDRINALRVIREKLKSETPNG